MDLRAGFAEKEQLHAADPAHIPPSHPSLTSIDVASDHSIQFNPISLFLLPYISSPDFCVYFTG